MHESGTFRYTEENLNYSTEAILKVFGKYFKTEGEAESCARNPQALADHMDTVTVMKDKGIYGVVVDFCNARSKRIMLCLQAI